uniref:Uncharacterized protein n=1 Tax=Anguilla anguilla TaxID=7936 RepID=A0A0E9VZ00_ANGAN
MYCKHEGGLELIG